MGHGRKRLQSSPILRILRGAASSVGGPGSGDTLSHSLDPLAGLDQDKGSFKVASDQMFPQAPRKKIKMEWHDRGNGRSLVQSWALPWPFFSLLSELDDQVPRLLHIIYEHSCASRSCLFVGPT